MPVKIYPALHRRLKIRSAETGKTLSELIEEMEEWYKKTHPEKK